MIRHEAHPAWDLVRRLGISESWEWWARRHELRVNAPSQPPERGRIVDKQFGCWRIEISDGGSIYALPGTEDVRVGDCVDAVPIYAMLGVTRAMWVIVRGVDR